MKESSPTRRCAAFHREAIERLFSHDQLQLAWLELDGRPVAAEYSLSDGHVLYAYQSGMDPAAAEHEPGGLALIATLRQAIDSGYRAVDFLRGDEPYKAHWRARPRPMQQVRILPGDWPGRLRQSMWNAANSAKDWLRAGRQAVLAVHRAAPSAP